MAARASSSTGRDWVSAPVSGRIVGCVKWVDLRPGVDSLTGRVTNDERTSGWSPADLAAVELGLTIAEAWSVPMDVFCCGPVAAERGLRELLAVGVTTVTRVEPGEHSSAAVAASLAAAILTVNSTVMVLCGDYSLDRGTGSVPAFLAHHLRAAQALGVTVVDPAEEGRVLVTRRLGGGRSERLELRAPMVVSVEGSVARLRRASLRATMAATDSPITVIPTVSALTGTAGDTGVRSVATLPLRPRPRALPAPAGADARDRILSLTGALVDRTPPRTIHATPDEAADAIMSQLRQWGYLDASKQ